MIKVRQEDALIVVDVQNDFCHGGALPVPYGDGIVSKVNRLVIAFDTTVFSRDWHPNNHCSFSDAPEYLDKSWPMHCVQNSPGAEFHGGLFVPTQREHRLGEDAYLLVALPDDPTRHPVAGKVAWITPEGRQDSMSYSTISSRAGE